MTFLSLNFKKVLGSDLPMVYGNTIARKNFCDMVTPSASLINKCVLPYINKYLTFNIELHLSIDFLYLCYDLDNTKHMGPSLIDAKCKLI